MLKEMLYPTQRDTGKLCYNLSQNVNGIQKAFSLNFVRAHSGNFIGRLSNYDLLLFLRCAHGKCKLLFTLSCISKYSFHMGN